MSTKTFLILASIILTSLKSFSQTSSDTSITCIPNVKLRIAARLIQKGALDSAKVDLLSQKVDSLQANNSLIQQRVVQKDSTIAVYQKLSVDYLKIEQNYRDEIANVDKQNAARQTLLDDAVKKLNGQKRKTIFVFAAGVGGTILLHSLLHIRY